jgi:tetratricopeptide (TPR) repeat protein
MNRKKALAFISIIVLISVGVSTWWGGREIWKVPALLLNGDASGDSLRELEESLKGNDQKSHGKYNLGVTYYKQSKYKEASNQFQELLDSAEIDEKMNHWILYNLGNCYYRLSEQEQDSALVLEFLTRSLNQFRTIIDNENQQEKYSALPVEKDEDALFNYTLVRKKLKIVRAKLAQERREQAENQQLYELLKELRNSESRISEQLAQMKGAPLSEETLQARDELMRQQMNNLDQLNIIREKMLSSVKK